MDGWMDGWMDGRTDGWMDGRIKNNEPCTLIVIPRVRTWWGHPAASKLFNTVQLVTVTSVQTRHV